MSASVYIASRLPKNWQRDEAYAEQVHDQIRTHLQGDEFTYDEIAVRVGVSVKTVERQANREGLARRVQRV